MFLSDLSIKKPVLATMMILALVLFGVISRSQMGVALYPNVDFPIASVSTALPGASPEVIESELTDPLEESISSVEGIRHISSSSSQGASRIIVQFDLERDVDIAAQDIRDKISMANRYLPADTEPPVISKVDISANPVIWLAVSGDMPRKYLGQVSDEVLKPRLETLRGVGSIVVGGLQEREMRIWLDARKMEAYHVTSQDVENAFRNKNIELPGGRIESASRELTVKTMGKLENTDAFNRLIISYGNGTPVRLSDIGFAEDGVADKRSVGRFNAVNSTGLGIIPRSGANHVDVCNRVKSTMVELRKILPEGVSLSIAYDTSEFIKNSISDVQVDIFLGGFLAALVVFIFLRSLGSTIIVALAIPTSLIGTFSVMYALGFTMNNISMLALSLCVGLVIDDAIVVIENIFRHGELGHTPMDAARLGTSEIAFAATAATLAIVAVFVPVAFIKGLIGRFYFQFGVTVSAAVMISLFVALTLTPMLCSRFLSFRVPTGRFYNLLENAFAAVEQAYRRILAPCFSRRLTVIAAATALFTASLGLVYFKVLDLELVQREDRNDFIARVECPVGTSLDFSDQKLAECESIILAMPELRSVFALMGAGGRRSNVNKGWLFIQLKKAHERQRTREEIMSFLRVKLNSLPGIVAYVEDITVLGGGVAGRNAALEFKIMGPELSSLADISKKIITRLRAIPGIVGVGSDMELTKPEIQVRIDRDKAGDLGVDVRTIASAINTLIGGREVGEFKHAGKSYDVRIRLIPGQRKTLGDIDRLLVRSRGGRLIRLSNIVQVSEDVGPDIINRYDRLRSITIYANLESGKTAGEAVEDTRRIIQDLVPPEYHVRFSGQAETMRDSQSSVLYVFLLTVLTTYMLLASQFESFLHPLTVMLALPLSFIGALGALFLTGNTLNIMSAIGILMLVGLVVKNSILLVDYTNRLRDQGRAVKDALMEAGTVRLRPILMTAISTIAGVLPVALGFGAGGSVRAPMAVAVIGGLTTSTLLTLVVVPVTYTLFDDISNKIRRKSEP